MQRLQWLTPWANKRPSRAPVVWLQIDMAPAAPAGEWCNGNTAVFGTVVLGSSPSSPANGHFHLSSFPWCADASAGRWRDGRQTVAVWRRFHRLKIPTPINLIPFNGAENRSAPVQFRMKITIIILWLMACSDCSKWKGLQIERRRNNFRHENYSFMTTHPNIVGKFRIRNIYKFLLYRKS